MSHRLPSLQTIASLFIVALAAYVVWHESARTLPTGVLWDFGSFYASAEAARAGMDPYGVYPLTFRVHLPGFVIDNPNLNPPLSAILFQPLTWLDPQTMFRHWWGLSAALYLICVALLVTRFDDLPSVAVAAWLVALAGFWDTLLLGQIYIPLVAAGIAAYLLIERDRHVAAALLLGFVVASKPNFLVVPVLFLLAGHWRLAFITFAAAAALSLAPLIAYGVEIYKQWFDLLARDVDRRAFLTNMSLAGLAARLGAPMLGQALSLALLGALAAWAVLRKPDRMTALSFGLFGALLASPIAWVHYALFLAPVILAHARVLPVQAGALMFMLPVPYVIRQLDAPDWVQLSVGSIYNWALILCFIGVAMAEWERWRASARSAETAAAE